MRIKPRTQRSKKIELTLATLVLVSALLVVAGGEVAEWEVIQRIGGVLVLVLGMGLLAIATVGCILYRKALRLGRTQPVASKSLPDPEPTP